MVINKVFSWSNLKKIQSNKFVTSTYIWLVVVPFFAKVFSKIEDTLSVNISGKIYAIDLTLPFSWQQFFFSALFFVLGNILFLIFCPKIIKDYDDVAGFIATGKFPGELLQYMDTRLKAMQSEHDANLARLIEEKKFGQSPAVLHDIEMLRQDSVKQQFWMIYQYHMKEHLCTRIAVSIFYTLGFVLFLKVSLDNIYWVLYQLLN